MGEVPVRVLLVDDFEPFRRFVRSLLSDRPEFEVIGEAQDGVQAVQKAEALKPDVIVLDIGLPGLNGIEAARRIRSTSPSSRILFLTENNSLDVAQQAMRTGAWGYILKSNAASELPAALNALLGGKRFTDTKLGHRDPTGPMGS